MVKRINAPAVGETGGVHGKRYRGAGKHRGKNAEPPEARFMTVRLSEFAREALSQDQQEREPDGASQVVRAIRCYLNDKDSAGPGWAYPAFLRTRQPAEEGVELKLSIDPSLWRSLEEEARNQRVSVRQMLEHAILYFAAELDAGRVTERILDDMDDA